MNKLVVVLLALLSLTVKSGLVVGGELDRPGVWSVPSEGFPTIQDAVDSSDVKDNDYIFVSPGEYFGAIIDRPLKIHGIRGEFHVEPHGAESADRRHQRRRKRAEYRPWR